MGVMNTVSYFGFKRHARPGNPNGDLVMASFMLSNADRICLQATVDENDNISNEITSLSTVEFNPETGAFSLKVEQVILDERPLRQMVDRLREEMKEAGA